MTNMQWAILALIGVCACTIITTLLISWAQELFAGWGAESASKSHFGDRRYWEKHRAKGK